MVSVCRTYTSDGIHYYRSIQKLNVQFDDQRSFAQISFAVRVDSKWETLLFHGETRMEMKGELNRCSAIVCSSIDFEFECDEKNSLMIHILNELRSISSIARRGYHLTYYLQCVNILWSNFEFRVFLVFLLTCTMHGCVCFLKEFSVS